MAAKRKCKGKNAKGEACGAHPLKPGTEIGGVSVKGKHCRRHDPDLPASVRFGSHAQAREAGNQGGRPRNPRPSEIMRRLVEDHVESVMAPHFRTLGYEVERNDKGELELAPDPKGGAKIYGESKDGEIKVTDTDDLGAMILAAEKLLDRIYGRPKQSTELTGAEGGPVEIVPVTREKAKAVGGILQGVGAEGNAR